MDNTLDESKWQTIFKEAQNYKFDNFGFSMMIGRLSRKFKKDPSTLKVCVEEANSFCNKYGNILKNDLAKLNKA